MGTEVLGVGAVAGVVVVVVWGVEEGGGTGVVAGGLGGSCRGGLGGLGADCIWVATAFWVEGGVGI